MILLDNPKLRGIHDIIGNLFDVSEEYSLAISTALGISSTNIVVDNENCAKEAINYLKENKLGRATFFPLNIIKPKNIDTVINLPGFIDVASNLIKYNPKYSNIILNQLGNVLVVDNIDNANIIAKYINYRYRIVTLNGELLHVGGSLTGGNTIKTKNIILEKYELENKIKEAKIISDNISKIEEKINEVDNNYKEIEDKIYLINKEKLNKEVLLDNYKKEIISKEEILKETTYEITGNNNILDNKLLEEEQQVLKEYYETLENKNKVNLYLNNLLILC